MKNGCLSLVLMVCSYTFYGQTLVRLGNQTIPRNEFLAAFRKNNSMVRVTDSAYRDYLNLYIRYKLKVLAAYDEKLDTMSGQISELQDFKNRISDPYLYDSASLNHLAIEAFTRSQHDIRISCIFVTAPAEASPADTLKAWKKVNAAYTALKNHRDFSEVALQYSENPFVKNNRGDLGYISVFDLPYSIETVAYQTPVGKFSRVFRTGGGYIFLKKTAERPAQGRIRIARILFNIPDEATETERLNTRLRADSIYNALNTGADFGGLAKIYINNHLSYQMDGVLPESGIAKYEEEIENANTNLKKDGSISEYYESFMFHIIKRVTEKPIRKSGYKIPEHLIEKIKADPRVAATRERMFQTILKQTGLREYIPSGNSLWEYTDSLLLDKKPTLPAGFTSQTVLFEFPDKKYFIADWIAYRSSLKYLSCITSGKANSELLDLFRHTIAFEYYREHLDKYNTGFAAQVNEFRDQSLLFEIMQRRVWNRASADSAGLRKYFDLHANNYERKRAMETTHSAVLPATLEEVRGQVITDYQNDMENQWIQDLMKKYPVTINENVLKTLPK